MRSAIFIFLSVCRILSVLAQDPAHITYTKKDGLISDNIFYVMQDSKGYIWICTDKGVSRFDGSEFVNYGIKEGLDGEPVFLCTEDPKGRIWFASYGSNLFYFQNDIINSFGFNDSISKYLPEECVKTSILIDKKENIILGTQKFGLIKITKRGTRKNLMNFPGKNILLEKDTILSYSFSSYIPPHANSIGINVLEGNRSHLYADYLTNENKTGKLNFYMNFNKKDSTILISSYNNLFIFQNGELKLLLSERKPIDCIFRDKQGKVYLGLIGGGINVYKSIHDLNSHINYFNETTVTHIYQDSQGNVFVGTLGRGLVKILDFNIRRFSIPGAYVADYEFVDKKSIYISFSNGCIYEIDKSNYRVDTRLTLNSTRIDLPITFTVQNHSNAIFTSDHFSNSTSNTKVTFLPFLEKHVIPKTYLSTDYGAIYVASSSRIFLHNQNGLHSISIDLNDIKRGIKISKLIEDQNGVIWILTNKGLFSIKNSRIIEDKSFQVEVKNLTCILNDKYILFTPGILQRINDSDTSVFWVDTKSEFSFFNHINNTEYLFLSGNNDLSILNLKTKKRIDLNGKLKLDLLDVKSMSLENETLWIIDNNNVYKWVDFSLNDLNFKKHIPFIEKIIVNNEDVIWTEKKTLISAFRNNIEINLTSIPSIKNQKFEYRLKSIDTSWHVTASKKIYFSSLSAGNYKFQVRTLDPSFNLKGRILEYSFIVHPPLWKNAAFLFTLFIFSGFSISFYSHHKRNSKLFRNTEKIIDIKEKNTLKQKALIAQMNPHFTFNVMNSIQGLVLNEDKKDSVFFINRYAQMIRQILKSSNEPEIRIKYELELIQSYIEIENIRFKGRIELETKFEDEQNMGEYIIPSMIIQPLVENCLKHGMSEEIDALKITIEIKELENYLEVKILDNGIGFSTKQLEREEIKDSFGLRIVSERLKILSDENDLTDYFKIGDNLINGKVSGALVEMKVPFKKIKRII